jgi:hypothetical protein
MVLAAGYDLLQERAVTFVDTVRRDDYLNGNPIHRVLFLAARRGGADALDSKRGRRIGSLLEHGQGFAGKLASRPGWPLQAPIQIQERVTAHRRVGTLPGANNETAQV